MLTAYSVLICHHTGNLTATITGPKGDLQDFDLLPFNTEINCNSNMFVLKFLPRCEGKDARQPLSTVSLHCENLTIQKVFLTAESVLVCEMTCYVSNLLEVKLHCSFTLTSVPKTAKYELTWQNNRELNCRKCDFTTLQPTAAEHTMLLVHCVIFLPETHWLTA